MNKDKITEALRLFIKEELGISNAVIWDWEIRDNNNFTSTITRLTFTTALNHSAQTVSITMHSLVFNTQKYMAMVPEYSLPFEVRP